MYTLSDYDYHLPPELIAQTPASPPESCRFLIYNQQTKEIQDKIFSDITTLIDSSTLIVFNNSKVLKARLTRTYREKGTDSPLVKGGTRGICEIFYLTSIDQHTFNALVRPGKKFKVGTTIHFNENISFTVDKMTDEGRQLTCNQPILKVLETYGQMPLPPYITYTEEKADPYQPVFASKAGSVAAPTASLHFTHELIQQLEQQGVQTAYTTLHVGIGTFKQVDVENIKTYDIHAETIEIDLSLFDRIAQHKSENKPILAVGTTVTRTLESLPYLWKLINESSLGGAKGNEATWQSPEHKATSGQANECTPCEGGRCGGTKGMNNGGFDTRANLFSSISPKTILYRNTLTSSITLDQAQGYIQDITIADKLGTITFASTLYLYPGSTFYVIDQLITNFHLPKSSLLMLVAGLIGYDNMKNIYRHAIDAQYRFYSFGDAMWLK